MRFNTHYVRVRKDWGCPGWVVRCLRRDCLDASHWPNHTAAMAAADAHIHMHEAIGAASS